jgi:hypothetical protein
LRKNSQEIPVMAKRYGKGLRALLNAALREGPLAALKLRDKGPPLEARVAARLAVLNSPEITALATELEKVAPVQLHKFTEENDDDTVRA